MKKCYRCGRGFDNDELRFCPYCGGELEIDREWLAKVNSEKDELERKNREKAEWEAKCQPYITKGRELRSKLSRYNFDNYKYIEVVKEAIRSVPVGSRMELTVGDNAGLNQLISGINHAESLLIALESNINSSNFMIFRNILMNKYHELKSELNFLKIYTDNKACTVSLYNFVNSFIEGGAFILKEQKYEVKESEFDRAINKGDYNYIGEEVSYYSIPDYEKNIYKIESVGHFCLHHNYKDCKIKYYRAKLYRKLTIYRTAIKFNSGMKSLIGSYTQTSASLSEKFLSYYSDLIAVLEIVKANNIFVKANRRGKAPEVIMADINGLKLATFAKATETIDDGFKEIGYAYRQVVSDLVRL